MKRHIALCFVGLLSVWALGCNPDIERVDIRLDTTPPFEHSITGDAIRLTHGTAVAITVKAYNDEGEAEDGKVSFLPGGTMALDALERDHDDDEGTQFVLFAPEVGTGTVLVYCENTNGEVEIPFEVIEQP